MSVLLLLYLLLVRITADCPNTCSCKWKGGKEWVECASRGLQGLPQGAREETQVLDLSDNQLLSLPTDSFFVLRLINLQKLYLSRSRIQRIAVRAFRGLQGLVELDLSENELEQVPTGTFVSICNLMRLSLAGNPLKVLHHDTFIHLDQLSFLDLSRCRLSLLESGIFAGLHALEYLRLNDNLLTNIPKTVLPLSASLHGLPMHGNPWHCDCQLASLYDWLRASQIQIPQEMDLSCAEPPQLKARAVRTLKTQELACIPKVTLTHQLDIFEGENVTINCDVHAIPRPIITWLLNGESFNLEHGATKDERIRYTYREHSNDGKIIASLNIFGIEKLDEGNYMCQAENAAGISWGNLTIRVLYNKHKFNNPSVENPKTGYVAAIAVGALLGTLLALGFLFLVIFLYARHFHSYSKQNIKQLSSIRSMVPLSIFKKNYRDSLKKLHIASNCNYSMSSNSKENGLLLCNKNAHFRIVTDFNTYNEQFELEYRQSQHMPHKFIVEPDIINEVNYQRPYQTYSEPFSSYLDRDGYPLNFGLPRLDSITHTQRDATCKTLSHIRQPVLVSNLTAYQVVPFIHQFEFLTCAHTYTTHPVFKIDYKNRISATFVSSPSSDCSNQSTVLAPHSLFHTKIQLNTGIVEDIVSINGPNITGQPKIELPESLQILEHLESPNEGYVGDTMNI